MQIRSAIYLILSALLILLVGFNAFTITKSNYYQQWIYGFCDSLAWTCFSMAFYIIARTVNKNVPHIKVLRTALELFMLLSVSPLINEICEVADMYKLSNYIYGIIVFLYYLTKHSIKLLTNERNKE